MGRLPTVVRVRALSTLLAAAASAACGGPQSALDTAGTDADLLARLFVVMAAGALLVWAAVVGAAIYAIRVRPGTHSEAEANLFILGGGVVLPTVVLGALLWYGLPALPAVMALPADTAPRVLVTGKQWWWRVQYMTPQGPVETANEIRLPVNQRVELQLTSPDVIHSFWVPPLAGKMDMIPGRLTRLALEPTRTGTFRGACAEYCGASHALMTLLVVVTGTEAFEQWVDDQARPAAAPAGPLATRGLEVFFADGCTACHTIRGTAASGQIGPDLTHLASRSRIGAGALPNGPDALAEWIGQTDRIKPGVHMPAFRALAPDDLRALAAYLGSLE